MSLSEKDFERFVLLHRVGPKASVNVFEIGLTGKQIRIRHGAQGKKLGSQMIKKANVIEARNIFNDKRRQKLAEGYKVIKEIGPIQHALKNETNASNNNSNSNSNNVSKKNGNSNSISTNENDNSIPRPFSFSFGQNRSLQAQKMQENQMQNSNFMFGMPNTNNNNNNANSSDNEITSNVSETSSVRRAKQPPPRRHHKPKKDGNAANNKVNRRKKGQKGGGLNNNIENNNNNVKGNKNVKNKGKNKNKNNKNKNKNNNNSNNLVANGHKILSNSNGNGNGANGIDISHIMNGTGNGNGSINYQNKKGSEEEDYSEDDNEDAEEDDNDNEDVDDEDENENENEMDDEDEEDEDDDVDEDEDDIEMDENGNIRNKRGDTGASGSGNGTGTGTGTGTGDLGDDGRSSASSSSSSSSSSGRSSDDEYEMEYEKMAQIMADIVSKEAPKKIAWKPLSIWIRYNEEIDYSAEWALAPMPRRIAGSCHELLVAYLKSSKGEILTRLIKLARDPDEDNKHHFETERKVSQYLTKMAKIVNKTFHTRTDVCIWPVETIYFEYEDEMKWATVQAPFLPQNNYVFVKIEPNYGKPCVNDAVVGRYQHAFAAISKGMDLVRDWQGYGVSQKAFLKECSQTHVPEAIEQIIKRKNGNDEKTEVLVVIDPVLTTCGAHYETNNPTDFGMKAIDEWLDTHNCEKCRCEYFYLKKNELRFGISDPTQEWFEFENAPIYLELNVKKCRKELGLWDFKNDGWEEPNINKIDENEMKMLGIDFEKRLRLQKNKNENQNENENENNNNNEYEKKSEENIVITNGNGIGK